MVTQKVSDTREHRTEMHSEVVCGEHEAQARSAKAGTRGPQRRSAERRLHLAFDSDSFVRVISDCDPDSATTRFHPISFALFLTLTALEVYCYILVREVRFLCSPRIDLQ